MRKIAGIRCFSASSSRKFTSSSLAPETALPIASRFSSDEKYGEKKNTRMSLLEFIASANWPS